MAKIITFDGHDGVGKTTLIKSALSRIATDQSMACSLKTAGDNNGIRGLPIEERILVYLKAWGDTQQKIREISSNYDFVLLDRSYYSTYVLAQVLNMGIDDSMYCGFLKPDLAIHVTLDEEERKRRMRFKSDKNGHDRRTLNPDLIRRANFVYSSLGLTELNNNGPIEETTENLYRYIMGL